MGVSIWVHEGPKEEERHDCMCEGTRKDCIDCNGSGEVVFSKGIHSVDMSEMTCRSLFSAINEPFDYGGEWPLSRLPVIQKKLITASNLETARRPSLVSPHSSGNIHSSGVTDERLTRLALRTMEIIAAAQDLQKPIYFG